MGFPSSGRGPVRDEVGAGDESAVGGARQMDLEAQGPGKTIFFGVAILRFEPTATTWLLSIRHYESTKGGYTALRGPGGLSYPL